MSVDIATIKRIATLSRLHVEAQALPGLVAEINGILGWIEQLAEVDTTGVPPMAGGSVEPMAGGSVPPMAGGSVPPMAGGSVEPMAGGSVPPMAGGSVAPMAGGGAVAPGASGANMLRWREDRVTDGGQADAVLANAPDREGEYFGVPKVVE